MQLYHFEQTLSYSLKDFAGKNVDVLRLALILADSTVTCLYFQPGGLINAHPAGIPADRIDDPDMHGVNQLFLVVQGAGWVRSGDGERVPVNAGQAAFWRAREWHESGSDEGMTVIVIEGDGIDLTGLPQSSI